MSSFKISKLFSAKGTVNRLREHCSLSSSNYCCLWSLVEVLFPGKVSYLQIPTFWLMHGSCCVRVGGGVETDTTTPNNVETATVRRRKDTTRKTLAGRPCVMRVCA